MVINSGYSVKTSSSEKLTQYKFCGNCSHANFNLNPEDEQLLKDTTERDGVKIVQAWTRPGKPIFTLYPHDRMKVIKIILTHQTYCNTAKKRIAWLDQACYRYYVHP